MINVSFSKKTEISCTCCNLKIKRGSLLYTKRGELNVMLDGKFNFYINNASVTLPPAIRISNNIKIIDLWSHISVQNKDYFLAGVEHIK